MNKFIGGRNLVIKKKGIRIVFGLLVIFLLSACSIGSSSDSGSGESTGVGSGETLVFADPNWDSIRFHNSVVQFIVENAYGYETEIMPGSTPATLQGLQNNDIQIYTEFGRKMLLILFNRLSIVVK